MTDLAAKHVTAQLRDNLRMMFCEPCERSFMKVFRSVAALIVFAAACSSAWSATSVPTSSNTAATAQNPSRSAPTPQPILKVGVTDPDTQLILPWFLTDTINAINARSSPSDLLRKLGHDL
ncbi:MULTISPECIES: hypothetical protein [Paraburkholderia]|uniref:hypothetical protein n=1 Tax=Paraburkholderia TaxID=1822464 RepID=UPI00224CA679|nr:MULTISPECIES: hypothetical protein [Paraburkholderia]MCX4160657.1 hypothetical protein [Paraburkholderia megapolitana]MDN7156155.1 hypothetical protein [Paraburkholderia sp. CHISQ3]MDQ6493199.1 hypothetical protein [Paraburkholderia megapolitana]